MSLVGLGEGEGSDSEFIIGGRDRQQQQPRWILFRVKVGYCYKCQERRKKRWRRKSDCVGLREFH